MSIESETASQEPSSGSPDTEPRSWALPVPDGAYARVPCWHGSDHWFDVLMDALATPEGAAKRKHAKVKATTLLAIANAYRAYADHTTGRGVTVCHERIRELVGRKSNKTIQRATRLLEALGFAVTVVEGRYLTAAEREQARQLHGGRQIKAASIVALTLPPVDNSCAVTTNVHLPVGSPVLNTSSLFELTKQPRASAKKEAAPRPQPRPETRIFGRQKPPVGQPREVRRQRFLADLDKAYGNLLAGPIDANGKPIGKGHHVGQIDRLLRRSGIDIDAWTVPELVAELTDKIPYGRGRLVSADDPLRYFGWMVRKAIEAGSVPRRVAIERRARQLAAERAETARERELDRQRMAADDPAESARILAEIHAEDEARRLFKLRARVGARFRPPTYGADQ